MLTSDLGVLGRCSKCILPVNLPGLIIYEDSHCNYCKAFEEKTKNDSDVSEQELKKRFEKILERSKGGSKYDCLVPISGGKDSIFVLYLIVKKYHMNVLAYNFDNGFRSVQAVKNIENAVNKLGIDFIVYKPGRDIMNTLFRTFLLRAGEFCTPCNMLIDASSLRIAKQNNIKLIMSGHSERITSGIEGMTPFSYYDRRYYLNVLNNQLTQDQVKKYVSPSYFSKGLRRLVGIEPLTVNVFDYLKIPIEEICRTIEREVNWKNPSDQIEHGDCLLYSIKNYMMIKKWGCSTITTKYSAMIRDGQIDRQEALELANNKEQKKLPKILPEFLNTLGVTESEFDEALKKDFREFPNIHKSKLFLLAKKFSHAIDQFRGY